MRKIIILCLVLLNFNLILNKKLIAKEQEFILVEFVSQSMADKSYPDNRIVSGDVRVEAKDIIKYTKKSCLNAIKDNISEFKNYIVYLQNGVFYNQGYGRMVCLEYDIMEKYIRVEKYFVVVDLEIIKYDNDLAINNLSQFSKDFPNVIPYIVKEEDIKNYTVFPLMKNQKEARKLTEELNKELRNEINTIK